MFLLPLLLLASHAASATILQDRSDLWVGSWDLGAWKWDSSEVERSVKAVAYTIDGRPGAILSPVLHGTIALPPNGSWTVSVQRDSLVELGAHAWKRATVWSKTPPYRTVVSPTSPAAWEEMKTPNGHLLRLSVPWLEVSPEGKGQLARHIKVTVHMSGTGSAPLEPTVEGLILNPSGGGRFGFASVSRKAGRSLMSSPRLLPQGDQCLVLKVRANTAGDLSQDRVVKITGSMLFSALGNISGVDFDHVAVACGGRGPIPLVTDSVAVDPSLAAIPIHRVDINGNGRFDPEDRIEFYAHGPSFWEPDTALGTGIHSLNVHPWDLTYRYLVRLDAPAGSPEIPTRIRASAAVVATSVQRPVWAGRQLHLPLAEEIPAGREWYWQTASLRGLNANQLAHDNAVDLPRLANPTGVVVVRLASGSVSDLDTFHIPGRLANPGQNIGSRMAWNIDGLKSTGNQYVWTRGNTPFADSSVNFESYTVHYPYSPSMSLLRPFPTPALGAFRIPIEGASEGDTLTAVEMGVGVRRIPLAGGVLQDSASTWDTWYVTSNAIDATNLSAWKAPSGPNQIAPDGWGKSLGIAHVVVAPDSFLDLASEYSAFRADPRRIRTFSTGIVRAEDLWLLCGNGSQDPLAIRNFLSYSKSHWGNTHALLMGGGHADPRGVTGAQPGPLPIWESGGDASDAVLQFLDPGEAQDQNRIGDVALGRIPARSHAELAAWLDKLFTWEDPGRATSGTWRNTMLATADDMQIRGSSPEPDHFQGSEGHTESSEAILGIALKARPWLQIRKIYEVEYASNTVQEKPEAQRALIDELNRGVATWQYIGHGGWNVLSDERLLDTRSALLQLQNANMPFLFTAGSCSVGRHDIIDNRGFSEALVVAWRKGALSAISATRASEGYSNISLISDFWEDVLTANSDGSARTLGEAFLKAVNGNPYRNNNELYNLLGDPASIPFPSGSSLSLTRSPETLSSLDTFRLAGRAEAQVQVNLQTHATDKTAIFTYGDKVFTQRYSSPGRTLVSFRTEASRGDFSAVLRTPARIPFGDSATIFVYGWNPSTLRDSAVQDTNVLMSGVGNNTSSDHEGPSIRILPCDSSWTSGQPFGRTAEIPLPFCLNIFFDDSSGISSSDAPDEGVLLSVPGTLTAWHPNLQEGSGFSQAWARMSLDASTFQPGKTYPLNVFARDLMGNVSSTTLDLHTRVSGDVDLYQVFNRPNPAKGASTTFYFKLLADADSNGTIPGTVQASIRIHTLSGKLIRILNTDLTDVGHPRPRAIWNLQDAFRNDVANGLYPYTVLLRVRDEAGGNWRQIEKKGIVAVSR